MSALKETTATAKTVDGLEMATCSQENIANRVAGQSQSPQSSPTGDAFDEAPTAASQLLVFDELASDADLIVSFGIGLTEAARRADRVRTHGYLCDVGRCFADALGAYKRIKALAELEARR